jgi:hypothetical protein
VIDKNFQHAYMRDHHARFFRSFSGALVEEPEKLMPKSQVKFATNSFIVN